MIRAILLAALIVLIGPSTADAGQGLIKVPGTIHIYWVDNWGIAHHVKNKKALDMYFGGAPVAAVDQLEFNRMERGGPVTIVTPPSLFDSTRNPDTVRLNVGGAGMTVKMDELERLDELEHLEDLEDIEDFR